MLADFANLRAMQLCQSSIEGRCMIWSLLCSDLIYYRTMAYLRGLSSAARLHVVQGKGHGMISTENEMREIMSFWSTTLLIRPPGEDVVELGARNL